jgi:hypothetical protein
MTGYPETQDVGLQTLAERLAQGPIPMKQALRYATLLGQTLRDLHDAGKSHGAVSSKTILLTSEGLELAPPAEMSGQADIPVDILGFGTVLAEMLANPGYAPGDPAEQDDHGIGPLIDACLASDPSVRPPNMRKALLELKVAALSARQSERVSSRSDSMAAMSTQLDAIEARVSQAQRDVELNASCLGDLERNVTSAIRQLESKLADAVTKMERDIEAQTSALETIRRSMTQTDDLIGRIVENFEAKLGTTQSSAEENAARIDAVERGIRTANELNAKLEVKLADNIRQLRIEMETRAAVVESVRKSMTLTDDLVGRVVEAVEAVLELNAARS